MVLSILSIHRALKPGGEILLVEFQRIPGTSSDFIMNHVRAGKEVFVQEITDAGFVPVETIDLPGLEENYIVDLAHRTTSALSPVRKTTRSRSFWCPKTS